MSKNETPLTRWYWQQIGGTIAYEFPLVSAKGARQARRLADALIIPDGEHREAHWRDIDIDGRDVIVVQTKASRLGMYLLGQAVFSPRLLAANWAPRSIRSVALCLADDEALHGLLGEFPEVEVVIAPDGLLPS